MSKISLEGNSLGTGTFTITSPNSNTNRTLTLPDSTGTVVVSGTTPSLNGITFPATQVASADANTLDDYEEGTWTPTYGGSSSDPTVSYIQQGGTYVKIGKLVQVNIFLFSSTLSGGSGDVYIKGLPFTSENTNVRGNGVTGFSDDFLNNSPSAGYVIQNSTSISLTYQATAVRQVGLPIANMKTTSGNLLLFTATYTV